MAVRVSLLLMLAAACWLAAATPASAIDFANQVQQGSSSGDWASGEIGKHSDWDVTDRASGGMSQILAEALQDFSDYKPRNKCEGSAASAAWYALADAANGAPLSAFLDAISSSLKNIKTIAAFGADPEAAAEMLEAGKLADQYIDTLKDQGKDAIKDKLKEIWSGKKKEVFRYSSNKGGCDITLLAVWDRAAGTYEIVIFGNCGCKQVPGWELGSGKGPQLSAWAVRLSGEVFPDKELGKWVYKVGRAKITVQANCVICPKPAATSTTGGGTATPPGGAAPPKTTPVPENFDDAKTYWDKRTTCPDCQSILDDIKKLMSKRDDLTRDFKNAKGQLEAAEGARRKDDIAAWSRVMQGLTQKDWELIQQIAALRTKLEDCEKEKCPGGHASVPLERPSTSVPVSNEPPPQELPSSQPPQAQPPPDTGPSVPGGFGFGIGVGGSGRGEDRGRDSGRRP